MSEENKNKPEIDTEDYSSHDFDGIKELNNPAPNWIVLIFLVTIGFALIYAIRYFGYPDNGMDQASEYSNKVAAFEQKKKEMQQQAGGVDALSLDDAIAAGEKLFLDKGCIACHGMHGEGNNIGPNLTDNYWIHGCKPEQIVQVIAEGVPAKGMTPYKNMITQEQMEHISSFILHKLLNSNPDNGKAPQGEPCNQE